MVPSLSPGSLEERDFFIEEESSDENQASTPDSLDERMNTRSLAAEAPMVSDTVIELAVGRDRAVVRTGWEPVAAAYRPSTDGARPGLLALLLS